jgi:hypothetical protein
MSQVRPELIEFMNLVNNNSKGTYTGDPKYFNISPTILPQGLTLVSTGSGDPEVP